MTNVGSTDRAVRLVAGVVLIVAALFMPGMLAVFWAWVLAAVGAVLVLTAVFRFCPAYTLLGMNTCATGKP